MPSLCHHETDYDNDTSSTLSFGRRPAKKRQRESLNAKMGQMLQRAALAAIPYAEAAGRRRSREQSAHSTSSTVVQHNVFSASTPVEDMHNSVRGNHVGEGFSVIKSGSSPNMLRSGFLKDDVPSWRGQENDEMVCSEKNEVRTSIAPLPALVANLCVLPKETTGLALSDIHDS